MSQVYKYLVQAGRTKPAPIYNRLKEQMNEYIAFLACFAGGSRFLSLSCKGFAKM